MFKYTRHTLKKIESLLERSAYTLRYERGSFQSGYCMVENKNIIVVNRFFDVEGRINVLLEILNNIDINTEVFDEKEMEFYENLMSFETEPTA